jgi:sarcosine oxidase subunit beta
MSDTYDVVIIGGGIIGASVAYHLAKKKIGKIAVIERDQYLGNGATAKCAGGIRAQFSSEVNVRMSMLSEDRFEVFTEETGAEVQFDQVGYLFLLSSDDHVANFKQQFEMWQRVGHPCQWLSRENIAEMVPALDVSNVLGGTFSRKDGIGDPHQFTQGYVSAARNLGVKFILETTASGITHSGDILTGVKTDNGDFATECVVNAAGPYSAQVAAWLEVELPIRPFKRQIVTTAPLEFIDESFPMVVDVGSGLYTHKESGGLLLGWADPDQPEGFDESTHPDYTDAILMKGLELIPQLETAEIKTAWGGLYDTTPDHLAILGPTDRFTRFFQANGFSGHGFMHAPAVGIVISEMIAGEPLSVDVSRLSVGRFQHESVATAERTVI